MLRTYYLQLECCNGVSAPASQCSAHGACVGLEGECCPTKDGVYLDCCHGETRGRECSINPQCASSGLSGNCCPPDFGEDVS